MIKLNSIIEASLVKVNGLAIANVMEISGRIFWPNFAGDDFIEIDDDPPDPQAWSLVTGSSSISSNKLRISTASGNDEVGSLFGIYGDFDIQIDVDLVTYPNTNYWNFSFRLWNAAATAGVTLEIRVESSQRKIKFFDNAGSWIERDSDNTSLTSTKFKFVRVSSTITASYWDGGDWVVSGTSTVLGTDTIYVRCKSGKWSSNPTAVADFDNFTINSGTVVQPGFWENFTGDNFTGTDGDPPDTRVWAAQPGYDVDYFSIQSNKLQFSADVASKEDQRYLSEFYISGDFDVQIDFVITQFDTPASLANFARILMITDIGSGKYTYVRIEEHDNGDRRYLAGDASDSDIVVNTDTSGKFRMTRSGSTIKGYVLDGALWKWNGSTDGYTFTENSTLPMRIRLDGTQEISSETTFTFDNLNIVSGTVVPP